MSPSPSEMLPSPSPSAVPMASLLLSHSLPVAPSSESSWVPCSTPGLFHGYHAHSPSRKISLSPTLGSSTRSNCNSSPRLIPSSPSVPYPITPAPFYCGQNGIESPVPNLNTPQSSPLVGPSQDQLLSSPICSLLSHIRWHCSIPIQPLFTVQHYRFSTLTHNEHIGSRYRQGFGGFTQLGKSVNGMFEIP